MLRWWLICSSVAVSLCFYMSRSDWPLLPILIGGVLIWPKAKYQILLLTGLASFFMRLSLSIGFPDLSLTGPLPNLPFLQCVLISGLILVEAVLLTFVVRYFGQHGRIRNSIFLIGTFIVLVALSLVGTGYVEDVTSVRLIAWPLRALVWLGPCALLTLTTLPQAEKSFWSVLASICQGWTLGIKHPFGALARWESREARVFDEVVRVQRKGLKLLLGTAVVVLVQRTSASLFSNAEVVQTVSPILELLKLLNEGAPLSFTMAWRYVLLDWFDFFFRAWVWGAMAIGILRLAGFELFRHTWRPWAATSIFDFFQRSLFYFNDVIFGVVFWPVFTSLRFRSQKVRVFLSLFLSVGLFNSLLTTGYEWFRGEWQQPTDLLLKNGTGFICYLTYATLLTIALYPSMLARLSDTGDVRPLGRMRFVRIGVFILFWSSIRIFERSLPGEYLLNWRLFGLLLGFPI